PRRYRFSRPTPARSTSPTTSPPPTSRAGSRNAATASWKAGTPTSPPWSKCTIPISRRRRAGCWWPTTARACMCTKAWRSIASSPMPFPAPTASSPTCSVWRSPSRNREQGREERSAGHQARAEIFGDGLADVGQRGARAQAGRGAAGGVGQQRRVLAGMVGGGSGGVAAVVGGEHQKVARSQGGREALQPAVALGQRGGVAGHIVAVAIDHVEVHQVGEDQPARNFRQRRHGLRQAIGIGGHGHVAGDAAAEK